VPAVVPNELENMMTTNSPDFKGTERDARAVVGGWVDCVEMFAEAESLAGNYE